MRKSFKAQYKAILSTLMLVGLLLSSTSFAAEGPTEFSISGGLYDAGGTAILNPSVDFRVEIYAPNGTCLLYSERHDNENLTVNKGGFALQVGTGTSRVNNVAGNTDLTSSVFFNNGVTSVTGCGSVTLNAGEGRLVRIFYDIGGGFVAMSPDIPMTSAAYAMVADSIRGLTPSNLVQVRNDNSTYFLGQTNLETVFNNTNWPRLQALLAGTSNQYMISNPTADTSWNGRRITNLNAPSAATDAANRQYVDGNIGGFTAALTGIGAGSGGGSTLVWDQVDNRWEIGVPSAVDATKLPLAGGTMSGAISMGGFDILNIGHMTIADQRTLRLGNLTNAQEATLTGTLGTGNSGVMFYNSQTSSLRLWNGTAYVAMNPVTSVAGRVGAVTLNYNDVGGLGTAATYTVGTGNGQIPALDSSSRFPAIDGGLLTNLNAVRLQGRTISSASPTIGQVLMWNQTADQWEPTAIPTAGITALSGDVVASGSGSVAATIQPNAITSAKINNVGVAVSRLLITDASTGAGVTYATCAQDEILKFNSSLGWGCSADAGVTSFPLLGSTGSAAAPTYSFTGDTNTGMYRAAGEELAFSTFGSERMRINGSGLVSVSGQINLGFGPIGSDQPTLSFGDSDTGFYSDANSIIFWGIDGINAGAFTQDALVSYRRVRAGNGSLAEPDFSFTADTDSGLYTAGTNVLGLVTGGTERLRVNAEGQIGIGTGSITTGAIMDLAGTGVSYSSLLVPRDTTALRPTVGVNGMIRYNTSTSKFEGYQGGLWTDMIVTGGAPTFPLLANPIGTNTAPAYSFNGDPNTGMYSPYADAIGFTVGGNERMVLDPGSLYTNNGNGSMYITMNPGTETEPLYSFSGDDDSGIYRAGADILGISTGGSERLRVNAAGRVGIGTTAPDSILHLEQADGGITRLLTLKNPAPLGSGAGTSLSMVGTGNLEMVRMASEWGPNTDNIYFAINVRRNGSLQNGIKIAPEGPYAQPQVQVGDEPYGSVPGSRFNVNHGATISTVANSITLTNVDTDSAASNGIGNAIRFWTETATNNINSETAKIEAVLDDATENSKDGSLRFSTIGPNAGNAVVDATEKMRIDSEGRVGIGTTSPYNSLVVINTGNVGSSLAISTPGTQNAQQAYFSLITRDNNTPVGNAGTKGWQFLARGDAWAGASQQNDFLFSYFNGSTWMDPFMIDSLTGNVAIGTNTPTAGAALDIVGTGVGSSSIIVPRETTALRPTTGVNGMIRFNTDTNKFEAYEGVWQNMIGGGVGGAMDLDGLSDAVWNATALSLYIGNNSGTGQANTMTNNVAVGPGTLSSMNNATADGNTAVGVDVLAANTSGAGNTGLGSGALRYNNVGHGNTSVGDGALYQSTSGSSNVAIGQYAIYLGNSVQNTAVGTQSMNYHSGGQNNTSLGYQAMRSNFGNQGTGSNNTAIGSMALTAIEGAGANNTVLGFRAADNLTTASNNIVIGHDIDAPTPTGNGQMTIGNLIFANGLGATGTAVAWGSVGIGTPSPTTGARLDVDGTGTAFSSMLIPRDTTALRPTGVNGMIRYNTSTSKFEGYAINWIPISGGFMGKLTYAGTASCAWATTGATMANFAADTDCPTATVTGGASYPGTKIPGATFANLPAGDYEVTVTAQYNNNGGAGSCRFRISDGTSTSGLTAINVQGESENTLVGQFSYTSQGNRTFQIQGARTAGTVNTCYVANDESGFMAFEIWVKRI